MAGFLDELRNGGQSALNSVKSAAAKYKSLDFRDGVLAISALVAAADKEVKAEEREKVKRLIMSNEALGHFTPSDLGKQFEAYVPKALDEFGVLDLETIVRKLRGKPEADMAVKIAIIIANSDGEFAESEKVVVRSIIKVLGLDVATYGL